MSYTVLSYKYGVILAILLAGLVIFQWEALLLPYFWDELAYYAPAALYQHDHSLSLLPNAVPPELSRGHPLLFSFLQAVWFRLFDTSLFSGHLFPLLIALSCAVSLFALVRKVLRENGYYAALAVALLLIQPVFLAQSTLILPEIALALGAIWAAYFYFQNRLGLTILFATITVLMKETGVAIPLSLLLFDLLRFRNPLRGIVLAIPIAVLMLFFGIQYLQHSWFFFPFHTELTSFNPGEVVQDILRAAYFLLIAQGRFLLLPLLFYGTLKYRTMEERLRSIWIFCVFAIVITVMMLAVTHLMNRYMLLIFPFYLLMAMIGARLIITKMKPVRYFLPLFTLPFLHFMYTGDFNMSADLGYRHAVKATENAYQYVVKKGLDKKPGYCHEALLPAFGDPRLGYNSLKKSFNLSPEIRESPHFAVDIAPSGWSRSTVVLLGLTSTQTINEGSFTVVIVEKE